MSGSEGEWLDNSQGSPAGQGGDQGRDSCHHLCRPTTLPLTHLQGGGHVCVCVCACVCVCVCACVDAVPVQCVRVRSRVYCVRMQCEMLCSHPPSHSSLMHAHSSSGGQVLSSATARGEGEGEEPLLNKMPDPTPLGSVCQVRLVPASMSCTVCLCRRSQLVTRPGLSPVLPGPAVSAHLWCQHLPLQ